MAWWLSTGTSRFAVSRHLVELAQRWSEGHGGAPNAAGNGDAGWGLLYAMYGPGGTVGMFGTPHL
jgi:hypothetical protein